MDAADALAEVLKGEGPRVLATLARTIGDLAVAEDALSEATITALEAWPRTGIPGNPRAWLAVVARRKALDLLRRESARAAKETAAFRWGTAAAPDQIEEAIEAIEPESSLRDDMLRLIFTCCHPALGREAQVALSLRTLPGSRCRPSPAWNTPIYGTLPWRTTCGGLATRARRPGNFTPR